MVYGPQSASGKAGLLTVIALLLLLPLSLLGGLVSERTTLRDAAVQSVARGWGDRQWLGGPLLAIRITSESTPARTFDWYVLPERLDLKIQLEVQDTRRRLGLYDVPVYVARIRAQGEFDLPRELARLTRGATDLHVHLDQARILIPVKDPRGLRALVSGTQEFQSFEPSADFPIPVLAAPLSLATDAWSGAHAFDFSLDLAGTQSFELLPLARSVQAQLQGNWPDPGFTDGFLPTERHIDAHGFRASWQVLNLNRTYGDRWFQDTTPAETLLASGFGVELVQPVDIYQRCLRAVKYGGLYIALSFLTLFLVENLQRRAIHPIQYGLMGLALSVFYLLLLALAEHIGFVFAYALATAALCTLMGFYLAAALHSVRSGVLSAGTFVATYALLYLLVTSESYALLAGALALFALLATAMLLTRNMDWYTQDAALSRSPGVAPSAP